MEETKAKVKVKVILLPALGDLIFQTKKACVF